MPCKQNTPGNSELVVCIGDSKAQKLEYFIWHQNNIRSAQTGALYNRRPLGVQNSLLATVVIRITFGNTFGNDTRSRPAQMGALQRAWYTTDGPVCPVKQNAPGSSELVGCLGG